MVVVTKLDNNLDQQSFLQFLFPEGNGNASIVTLPFFENPMIEESGNANFIEYNPQSRGGSLFSYTGAKSRSFNLSFKITYPHIMQHALKKKFLITPIKQTKEEEKEKFFKNIHSITEVPGFEMVRGSAHDFFKEFSSYEEDVEKITQEFLDSPDLDNKLEILAEKKFNSNLKKIISMQVIDIISYWLNIIRSSTINNAEKPTLGPPIIRLNHGIMYQDIPCICTDFKISHTGDSAGYDQATMLPRAIAISMSLREHRTGNFGTFDVMKLVDRDNVAGWEAVLKDAHTLDPISRRFTGPNG